MPIPYDVAIVGGGPAGSTCGSLLRKYNPDLKVLIVEKERFPREHVGESQLPACCYYLDEMGCWDKVEREGFPIKVGATYRWGTSDKLWDFEFLPLSRFEAECDRPGQYKGARKYTAFQVERSRYDKILLDHAAELGCEVREETKVRKVNCDDDKVTSIELSDGDVIEASHFVDASGHIGVLRRPLGVDVEIPTSLQNIAMWDYWENAEWAVSIGVGGTRVQVLSVDTGWIWFIPLSETRTSIGFICPASYYKASGKTPEQLYTEAISAQSRVKQLTAKATRKNQLKTTSDWSFVSDRMVGENWFLVGEAAGFADPILAGGLTLAHASAAHAAYVILSLESGEHEKPWLLEGFESSQKRLIMQFIRFADFWYAANGQFTDLQEFCGEIAKESGVDLSPQLAFRWLSLGGFTNIDGSRPGIGGLDLEAVKVVTGKLTKETPVTWNINRFNIFDLDLGKAEVIDVPIMHQGKIAKSRCYRKGNRLLPSTGIFGMVLSILEKHRHMADIARAIEVECAASGQSVHNAMHTLETLLGDGWIRGKKSKRHQTVTYRPPDTDGDYGIHDNHDKIGPS